MLGQCCLSSPYSCGATQASSQLQSCTRLSYSSIGHYSISLDHGCWDNAVCLPQTVVTLHRLAVNYSHVRGYLTPAYVITQSAWIMDVGTMLFVIPRQLWRLHRVAVSYSLIRGYPSISRCSISLDHGCWDNAVCPPQTVVALHRPAVTYSHVRGYLTPAYDITQSAWIMDVGTMLFVLPRQLWRLHRVAVSYSLIRGYLNISRCSISLDHGCWDNAVCLLRAVVALHRLAVNYSLVRGYLTRTHLIAQSAWIMDVGSMLFVFPEQLWCYTSLQSITDMYEVTLLEHISLLNQLGSLSLG
ncbi:hypothetical protein J6590_094930 [Homalodisca vitripennis]|nr:hypothetical protein J6590_094930 [Homalodisca vitripennis]